MIQKYSQFINENANHTNELSVYEKINEPFTSFIDRAQERLDIFKSKISDLLKEMDIVIEDVVESFTDISNIVVGEPEIEVEDDLSEITVKIHTTVPNDENAWVSDESPAQDLEYNINQWFPKSKYKNTSIDIVNKPDDDVNCVIEIRMSVIDSDHFGDYTDALETFGEEW